MQMMTSHSNKERRTIMTAFTTQDLIKLWEEDEYENFIYVVAQLNKEEVRKLVARFRKLEANELADIVEQWNENRTTFEDILNR